MPKTRGSWKAEISNWDGIRLKQVRVMQGNISQEDFAKLANVTKFHVSDIESGRIKPSSNVIAAVAKLGYDIIGKKKKMHLSLFKLKLKMVR